MPADPKVIYWIENVLAPKLLDDEFMLLHLAMLKVGHDQGDAPQEILRKIIASAVCEAAGMNIAPGGRDISVDGN